MKPKSTLRNFLALAGSSILAISSTHAATYYWDAGTVDIAGNGNGVSGGGATGGTWNSTIKNWDAGVSPYVAWTGTTDTAVFGGTAAVVGTPVTLGTGISVGGLRFDTTGYFISTGANTLSFAATNNTILFNNAVTTATINGAVGGDANKNVILSNAAGHYAAALGTLTIGGTSTATTGWSGSTTINAGMTLALSGDSRALASTSSITLNGGDATVSFARSRTGGILITNTNSTQAGYNRVNDSAAIISNGGFITVTNSGATTYSETMGALDLRNGNLNVTQTNSSGTQTLTFGSGSLTTVNGAARDNTTRSTINFGGTSLGAGVGNMIKITDQATTAQNEIIAPWATYGGTDYAVYNRAGSANASTNTLGIQAANITASAQSTWSTTLAATSNYTLANADKSAANGRLSATRNINTLRSNTALGSWVDSVNSTSEYLTMSSNTYANGDVLVLGATAAGGLVFGTAYYVINKDGAGAGTFQLSTTQGGAAVDMTGSTGRLNGGITLSSGNNLNTYGILNAQNTSMVIGGAGTVSTPSGGGNLYLNNSGGTSNTSFMVIDSVIADNGGAVTVVKDGGMLVLSKNNTFTGGLVVNSGGLNHSVRLLGPQSFTGGITLNGGGIGDNGANGAPGVSAASLNGNAITVNGAAHLMITAGETLATTSTITINSTAALSIGSTGSNANVTGVVSGSGLLDYGALNLNGSSAVTLSNNANTFTGNVIAPNSSAATMTLNVNSIGDGGKVTFNSSGTGTVTQIFAMNSTATAGMTFNTRQFELAGVGATPRIANNSGQAFTINTDLLVSGTGARTLQLYGTGTGLSTFAGKIGDGSLTALGITKAESGTWALSGANSYTGTTTVSAGTLGFANGALGATGTINASDGTLLWLAGNTQDISSRLAMTAAKTSTFHTNGNNVNFASAIGSATTGSLSKTGLGTLTLNGLNTYTGSTTLNAGTLKLNYDTGTGGVNDSKLSNTASTGTLLLKGGTLELNGGSHVETVLSTTLTDGTSFVKQTGGTSTLSMGVITYTSGALNFSAAGIANVSTSTVTNGILSSTAGAARVTVGGADWAAKDGSNNVIAYTAYDPTNYAGTAMTANLNYKLLGSASVTTNRGASSNTLKITTDAASQSTAISTGATFTLGSLLFAGANDYSISTTGTGRIAATLLHNYGSGTLTLGSLGVALTQYGTGKTILSADAGGDYGMTIAGGTVQISNNLQIGTNGTVKDIALNNGTLLASENVALNSAGLLSRTISLGAGGGTLAAASTKTLTVSGVISGAGNPLAVGSATDTGTVELTGTNTYTGPTTVNGGKLLVNGNISTSLLTTVKTGATLGGSGTVGALTIDSGGTFAPGNSPGIETVNGNYLQNGTLAIEIEGLIPGNSAGNHDQVVVNGTVTLNGLLTLPTFSGSYSENAMLFILLNDGVDAITGTFTGKADGSVVSNYGGFDWTISYFGNNTGAGTGTFTGGNDVVLMAIPEPRAALLGGIGMLLLLRRRRN